MNKENETLLTRTLLMINGLLAFTYVVIGTWLAVELFNMIFQENNMAGKYDFDLYQGATFNRALTIKDENNAAVDITNCTFAGQIRTSALSGTVS